MKKLWTLLFTLVFAVGLISPMTITTTYAASGAVMTVGNTAFYSHEDGWEDAVKRAKSGGYAYVQLHADWIAENGAFVVEDDDGSECGT